jgi:hypothetical protein
VSSSVQISAVWGGISSSLLSGSSFAVTVGKSSGRSLSASPCEGDWVWGRSVCTVQEEEEEEEVEDGRRDADAGLSSAELDEGKPGTREAEAG